MILSYANDQTIPRLIDLETVNAHQIENAIWFDVISPNRKEEKFLENFLEIDIPTREEMKEIEPSSRLYKENDALYMTATMVAHSESDEPTADAVTFILTDKILITIRYIEPQSFKTFIARLSKISSKKLSAEILLIRLLETTTDRLADILENVSHQFDTISQKIFRPIDENEKLDYKHILQQIGLYGDLATKARESLISFMRLVSFWDTSGVSKLDTHLELRLKTIVKDVTYLSDYAGFISTKVNFLLDATLGMVNIEQNSIIKIFSVAAVIFLPPTLIASIYGMNFIHMPELNWKIGYPIALFLMILSAWLPYQYFKKKKWL